MTHHWTAASKKETQIWHQWKAATQGRQGFQVGGLRSAMRPRSASACSLVEKE